MHMNPFSKKNRWTVKVTVTVFFVVWLIAKVKWGEVWQQVRLLDVSYVLAYLTLLLIGVLISAQKWSFIARTQGFHLSVRQSFRAYLTGMFLNNFFPSTIGGDTYRALWLAGDSGRKPAAFFTVLLDRFSGLVATLLLALCFSFSQWPVLRLSAVWTSAVALLGLGCLAVFGLWLFGRRMFARLQLLLRRGRWQSVMQKVQNFVAESFSRRVFVGSIGYALLFNFVGVGVSNYILFQSIGIHISFLAFASVIFLISIISSLPVSINNIGIKEWAYYTFFGLLGVNAEAAIAVALTGRVLQMLVSFLALPTAWRWIVTKR